VFSISLSSSSITLKWFITIRLCGVIIACCSFLNELFTLLALTFRLVFGALMTDEKLVFLCWPISLWRNYSGCWFLITGLVSSPEDAIIAK